MGRPHGKIGAGEAARAAVGDGVVAVDRLVLSVGAGDGAEPRSASAASAVIGISLVGARRDHSDVEVGDAKTKPPTWHAKCQRDLCEGNTPKP